MPVLILGVKVRMVGYVCIRGAYRVAGTPPTPKSAAHSRSLKEAWRVESGASAQAERVRPAICRRGESEFARCRGGRWSRCGNRNTEYSAAKMLTGDWASDSRDEGDE